jgi:hypothetical protein
VGPTTDITLTTPQTLRPTPQTYFVLYDISPTAQANDSVGIRVQDMSWVSVSTPNYVVQFPMTTPATLPFNTLGYFDSSLAQILPISVKLQSSNQAPLVALPGNTNVPILQLRIASSINQVVVSSITVYQTGTIGTSPVDPSYYNGLGDGDFYRLKLWLDNGDGIFDPTTDTLLTTLPNRKWVLDAGLNPLNTPNFSGSVATLPCGVSVDTNGKNFWVSADIGTQDLGNRATYGHTAGLQLLNWQGLNTTPSSVVSDAGNTFPYQSINTSIADVSIVSVNVRPDEQGILESGWFNSNTSLSAAWQIIKVPNAQVNSFKAAIGTRPNIQDATLGMGSAGWLSVSTQAVQINGLSLSEPVVVFLTDDFLANNSSSSITVAYPSGSPNYGTVNPTDNFSRTGTIVIDKEMISYSDKTTTSFTGIKRGVNGTLVADHFKSSQVTSSAYFFQVKAETNLAGETPAHFGVVRIDLTPPTAPASVMAGSAITGKPDESGKYELQWNSSKDFESGVQLYEIQERTDTNPVWKDINFVSGDRFSDNIGDGIASDINGNPVPDLPRAKDHFYYYRMRAMNYAGSWGPWSAESAPAATGIPAEVISSVSNYPNPVDTRKGGEEGKTSIVYILNQNAEVNITLYDLLGYSVYSWTFSPGSPGGTMGANRVLWDGTNGSGNKVAKGGYIAQIKVKSDKGIVTTIRKIGVIH